MAVPNTSTFSLQDVVNDIGPASNTLQGCFTSASASGFDPTYEGSKDRLSNFRNYQKALNYGLLYNYYTIQNTLDFLPSGLRVPTKTEVDGLKSYIETTYSAGGSPLKTTYNWGEYNGTNNTKFSALPAGRRNDSGTYEQSGTHFNMWSSSEYYSSKAFAFSIDSYNTISITYYDKGFGFSIRGMRDLTTTELQNPALVNDGSLIGTITDYDGNIYNLIRVGDYAWMEESLRVKHFTDGTNIYNITDSYGWYQTTSPAWVYPIV